MKWDGSAARSAQWRQASPPAVAVGVVVLLTLALMGWTLVLVLLSACTLVALAVVHHLGTRRPAALEEEEYAAVAAQIHHIDAERRDARARMHAIRSIVAGIVSANQLLRSLPEDRRESFESMVDAELDRLTRILRDETTARIGPIQLDDLIDNLVTAHRSRGRSVSWEPRGLSAIGRHDDVAEALNVLIDNAAVHGDPDDIRVAAELRGSVVVVSVTDSGSGIPDDLRGRVFRWGERRAGSPGEGIGLNMAQTLVRESGGSLELDDVHGGTRFVMTLPATERSLDAHRTELHIA